MGAGLITVVVPETLRPIVEAKLMEVMSVGVPDQPGGFFCRESIPRILESISKADVVVVGPGMGLFPGSKAFMAELVPQIRVPFLVDADGLNALEGDLSILRSANAPCIVTPHPGEMSRLTGESIDSIESSRIPSARHLAEEQRVTVILKGARTVVATPMGDVFVNTTGNPYMASGGMGDTLGGMIAALASQGLSPNDAACAGVYLHGMSADILVRRHPISPVSATDVIENIYEALQHTLGEPREEE
jgi:NAD(P)H-hydrate epimerase